MKEDTRDGLLILIGVIFLSMFVNSCSEVGKLEFQNNPVKFCEKYDGYAPVKIPHRCTKYMY